MNTNHHNNYNDTIDFKELFKIIWSKKLFIIIITITAASASVYYSLTLPNIYTSKALLAPTSTSSNSLNNQLGAISSIAGIAGINMQPNSSDKTAEAIERMQSYDFFVNEFLPNIEVRNLVAAISWNKNNNSILYDEILLQDIGSGLSKQKAFEIYTSLFNVSQDSRTSFVLIKIEHISPFIAQKWLNLIIKKINNHMRELDKSVAESSIDFLNNKAQETKLSDLREVIFNLIENQIQALTLAEATEDYIFKPITSPLAPEKKSKPSRASISISGTIAGFILSIILAFILHYTRLQRTKDID